MKTENCVTYKTPNGTCKVCDPCAIVLMTDNMPLILLFDNEGNQIDCGQCRTLAEVGVALSKALNSKKLTMCKAQTRMKLYKISQEEYTGYDTYDSAVVCAETAEDAAKIHPRDDDWPAWCPSVWASTPANVTVVEIGIANENTQRGVVCASFHAG